MRAGLLGKARIIQGAELAGPDGVDREGGWCEKNQPQLGRKNTGDERVEHHVPSLPKKMGLHLDRAQRTRQSPHGAGRPATQQWRKYYTHRQPPTPRPPSPSRAKGQHFRKRARRIDAKRHLTVREAPPAKKSGHPRCH